MLQIKEKEVTEKMEIDVDKLLFEIVKDMDLDVYSFYKLRTMVYEMFSLSKEDRMEFYRRLEVMTGIALCSLNDKK